MELIKEKEEYLDVLFSGKERVSVNTDVIVPDSKPDVLKVLEVNARTVITDKGITNGAVYAEGKLFANILYIPDSDTSGICSVKAEMDFKMRKEEAKAGKEMRLFVNTDVLKADFGIINSRKLSVRADIEVYYEAVGKRELETVSGFEGGKGEFVTKSIQLSCIGAADESGFMIRDTIEIPAGKASADEIIKTDACISVTEYKPLGGKVISNGTLDVCVLYLSNDMSIEHTSYEIPFTEVFDVYGLEEGSKCDLDISIDDIAAEITEDNDGEKRLISIECSATARIVSHEDKRLCIIDDCYCPGMDMKAEYEKVTLKDHIDDINAKNSFKEIIPPDQKMPEMMKVYNVIAQAEPTSVKASDGAVTAEGRIKTYILYITDDPKCSVYSLKKDIPFSYTFENRNVREGMICDAKIRADGITFSVNGAGSVEFRCILTADIAVTKNEDIKLIRSIEVHPKEDNNDIVIYFVKDGDTVWDIAKKYAVKKDDITAVNSLENETVQAGQKILIPICR